MRRRKGERGGAGSEIPGKCRKMFGAGGAEIPCGGTPQGRPAARCHSHATIICLGTNCGRVTEVALSYPAQEQVAKAVGGIDLDEALAEIGTVGGVARAQEAIRGASRHIVSR
jgi:hypothetical protein